ncbi:hypothetical protein BAPKO_6034 (plasmid) [Borreliella afzelii PKo]|uniref:hypothetical protein n=1 Tax=Borreliella afzelii TaxID=29518 RepID=UPI0000DB939C|nr:hypothetical protein BAPKO_6034 [Borreliella afzelii PKo]
MRVSKKFSDFSKNLEKEGCGLIFEKNLMKVAGVAIGEPVGQAIAGIIIQIEEFIWVILKDMKRPESKKSKKNETNI